MSSSDITIIIGTYGSAEWQRRGLILAKNMRAKQTYPAVVMAHHGEDLQSARNLGAASATTNWLVFLDADDALDDYYCEAMSRTAGLLSHHNAILRPSVRGFRGEDWLDPMPVMGKTYPLIQRNFLTIGSMVSRYLFQAVGGFDAWPCLEDWALWLKCVCESHATIFDVPDAVYFINDEHERNQHADIDAVAHEIRNLYRGRYQAVAT